MPDAARDRDLLTEAAEAAGEIALRFFRTELEIREKPGQQGPVTEADEAIDRMLREELLAARPDYGWLSEETEDSAERLQADRVFIVDPIDGTRAFLAGEPGFAVSIAVAEAGRIVAAAVSLPARGETYAAGSGLGATRNAERIHASRRGGLEGASLLAVGSQLRPDSWPGGVPPVERSFRPSLAWRLCLVAAGRFDAMLTFRDAWEWDIAAGALIASEAGAEVSDSAGDALRFNKRIPLNPGVIAAPAALHAELLRRHRGR